MNENSLDKYDMKLMGKASIFIQSRVCYKSYVREHLSSCKERERALTFTDIVGKLFIIKFPFFSLSHRVMLVNVKRHS